MTLKFERGIPMVAASFKDTPVNMDVLRDQGLDIAEIRVDLCTHHDIATIYETLSVFQDAGIKTMLTIRSLAHGGRWTRSHEERIDLIMHTYDAVDIIDIEDDCEVPNELRDVLGMSLDGAGPLLLVSHHNTRGTPTLGDLCVIRERALEKQPDLIKIATHVRPAKVAVDMERLAKFIIEYGSEQNLIVIGMGGSGLLSRIEFPQYGSPITFCYRETPTAPGQLTLDDTVNLLRMFYPCYDAAMAIRLQSMKFS